MAQLVNLLMIGFIAASAYVWLVALQRGLNGRPLLAWREREKSGFLEGHAPPRWHPFVLVVTFLWLVLHLAEAAAALVLELQVELDVRDIQHVCVVNLVLCAVLLSAMAVTGRRGLADYGVDAVDWPIQFRDGAIGFLASLLPVFAVLWLTSQFRDPDAEHPFLKLLDEDAGATALAWVTFAAVIAAPLAEELVFRVILQGWLEDTLPAGWAIGLVAVAFSAVHGWPDALPLFPLALVLGYVFHRRRSYLAVVTVHVLFNGIMILAALFAEPFDGSEAIAACLSCR